MRTKFLLFLMLIAVGSVLNAQDTIRTLIISEARFDQAHEAYCELTNVGNTTLSLKDFEFGHVGCWDTRVDVNNINAWFVPVAGNWFMLPDWQLAPGKSIVIANVNDYRLIMQFRDPDNWGILTKPEMWKLVDIRLDQAESPKQPMVGDSVSPYAGTGQVWGGRDCWYVRHHVAPGDSVVVDQVGGVFDGGAADGVSVGANKNQAYDVAGVSQATVNDILVRKFTVKQGNINFNSGRGTTLSESEWIPIPILVPGGWEPNRALFWTVKNHENAVLNSTTLTSSSININWTDTILTVPWGVRDDDSIMYQFKRTPGFAWHYHYSPNHADSAFVSCRTGDMLTIYACGDSLSVLNFHIVVAPPTDDANIVVPKKVPDNHMTFLNNAPFCTVSDKVPGMDTISNDPYPYGIAFATPVDSLLKYLEKAPAASWEIVYVDGVTRRTDLKNGDILKVTSKSGVAKEYFIKVKNYRPAHNANLASITWPDIPDAYRGLYGWVQDTIPTWAPAKYNYKVQVPADVIGIPALVAKNADINAKLKVERAKNLTGSVEDKTVSFISTAEDDTTILTYKVQLEKQKATANVQPWKGEPFISQYIFQQDFNNSFLEIVNPGTAPLDLSHYMITSGYWSDPAASVRGESTTSQADWTYRYKKYIPGDKWQDSTNWHVKAGMAIADININPVVQPGDVFAMGSIADAPSNTSGYPAFIVPQLDIDFLNNPWGENLSNPWDGQIRQWWGAKFCLFKILNDSVRLGTKPATDPNDFELIDVWGYNGSDRSVVGGIPMDQCFNFERKPYIYKGDTVLGKSFGTTEDNSEWTMVNESRLQLPPYSYGWPAWRIMVADGIGSHFMNEVTVYKSTITSNAYRLTEGYSLHESLWGVKTGTNGTDFKANIIKADTGQTLTLLSHVNGAALKDTAKLVSNDTLLVISADKMNKTKYILTVTAEGLSSDAVLTSAVYTITHADSLGTVSGFPYGTLLDSVVVNVIVPANATFTVINGSGAYVPFRYLNYDTMYSNTKVSDDIYFVVVADNGTTKIVYQLKPTTSDTAAFVTSEVYSVNDTTSLIDLVPRGTTVYGLMRYLTPAPGSKMTLIDKLGLVRTMGDISQDDKLVDTAADGKHYKVYYLSMLDRVKVNYLAYVISNVYTVDQINHNISGMDVNQWTTGADLLANVTPAPSATVKVMTSGGAENTGLLNSTDALVVTAGDGATVVEYSITIVTTSVAKIQTGAPSVFPNPSSGLVTLSGINAGNRIVVSNILGQQLFARTANGPVESLSLRGQASGVYFIMVSNNNKVVAHFKLILK